MFKIDINKIIDFLETDKLSISFSSKGLKYLSLEDESGYEIIDLRKYNKYKESDPMKDLVITKTINLLNTGSHNMKLDLEDLTDFQRLVLNEVGKIKAGEIYTYGELAVMIDNPNGARAVGNALSKNPVSYFIPTHRILPKRGIGDCKSGAGFLREKLLMHEGHSIEKLR